MNLDLKEFTIDGKPIQSEDIAILISQYSLRHPEDEMWRHVVEVIVGNNYTQKFKRG